MVNLDRKRSQDRRIIRLSSEGDGVIIRIDADGNCLFKAIAERCRYLGVNIPSFAKDHRELRKKVVEELSKPVYRQTIIAILSLEREKAVIAATDVVIYLQTMSQPGTFGGAPEIIAISNILKCRILVHQDGQIIKMPQGLEYDHLPNLIEIIHEPVNAGFIGILANNNSQTNTHYNLVVDIALANKIFAVNKVTSTDHMAAILGTFLTDKKVKSEVAQLSTSSTLSNNSNASALLSNSIATSEPASAIASSVVNIIIKDKLEDLAKLSEISLLIDKIFLINSFSQAAVQVMVQIGTLSSDLHYNDEREGKSEYIRNKYGLIDRSNSAKRREGGLEIIHLAALGKIISQIDKVKPYGAFSDFQKDLGIIRSKINLIIEAENDPPTQTLEEVLEAFKQLGTANNLMRFISYFYAREIVEELTNIVDDSTIQSLDFRQREDRYYLGRVLSQVGELSKDLKDFVNPGNESGLFSFFKKIRDLKMAHSHSVMVADIDERQDQSLQLLRTLLTVNFKKGLNQLTLYLSSIDDITTQTVQNTCSNIKLGKLNEAQKTNLNKLFKVIFDAGDDIIDEKVINDIAIIDLPAEPAVHIVQEQEAVKKNTIVVRNVSTSIENIIRKVTTIQKLQTTPKKEKQIAEIASETLTLIRAYNLAVADDDELKIQNNGVLPTLEFLAEIKVKLANSKASLAVVERQLKEKETSIAHEKEEEEEITVKDKEEAKTVELRPADQIRLKKQIAERLSFASKELAYIMQIITSQKIESKKKDYVVEFGFSKIGQIFKDIEKKERELLKDFVPKEFNKSMEVTESVRHILMHDMFTRRNMSDFSTILFRHTLPVIPEIEALIKVLSTQATDEGVSSELDVDSYFELGRAYTALNHYDRAYECFNNMLRICNAKINLADGSIDFVEIFPGICNAYNGLALVYGAAGNDENNYGNKEKGKALYENQILHLERSIQLLLICPYIDIFPNQLASSYNNIACAYSDVRQLEKSIEYHTKAIATYKKIDKRELKREALYLSNLGLTYILEYKDPLRRAVKKKDQDVKYLTSRMHLAVACLWEARDIYERSGMPKENHDYIQVTVMLIQALLYSADAINWLFAKELYNNLDSVVAKFPARASSIEIGLMVELKQMFKDFSLEPDPVQSHGERFRNDREIVDTEFEFARLNLLEIFYLEIGIKEELRERIDKVQKRLSEFDQSKVSETTMMLSETGVLINQAALLYRQGSFTEALRKYLTVLSKINATKRYEKLIPYVIGDLLEDIGDTYSSLNKPEYALRNFEQSLEQHIKHKPNDRAFHIPRKIFTMYKELYPNDTQRGHYMAQRALENFQKNVDTQDLRLVSIKRVYLEIYMNSSPPEYDKASNALNQIGQNNFNDQDKKFSEEVEKYRMRSSNSLSAKIVVANDIVLQTPKIVSTKQTSLTTLENIKLREIERKVLDSYESILNKKKGVVTSDTVEVTINGSFIEKDLVKYLQDRLGLDKSHLTFDIREPSITLNKSAMAILDSMAISYDLRGVN